MPGFKVETLFCLGKNWLALDNEETLERCGADSRPPLHMRSFLRTELNPENNSKNRTVSEHYPLLEFSLLLLE